MDSLSTKVMGESGQSTLNLKEPSLNKAKNSSEKASNFPTKEWEKFCSDFYRKRHIRYFERMLDGLPSSFASQETNLLTVIYFCVGSLDLIDASDSLNKRKSKLIDLIYSLQSTDEIGGFFGNLNDARHNTKAVPEMLLGTSIAMSFAALSSLVILGDDLTRVDRNGIIRQLNSLQAKDGSLLRQRYLRDISSGSEDLHCEETL